MRKNLWLPIVPIAAGLSFLVSSACGILSAPVSVPMAIAANHNAQLEGDITDGEGRPLDDVTLRVRKEHVYWDAMMGTKTNWEDATAQVSQKFSVWRRSSGTIELNFSKPGYGAVTLTFDDQALYVPPASAAQPSVVDETGKPLTGKMPLPPKVRIILYPTPGVVKPGSGG